MVIPKKMLRFMGSSRKDLAGMPERVRRDFGGALHGVQQGWAPDDAKPLKGRLAGVTQLSADFDKDTYRAVYTVEMEGYVYVLHCFQKKSKAGIATPRADLDLIETRLKAARMLHERLKETDR